ncbi:hypothetical protein GJ744_008412 [Endocarpon pusillum]|uniref:Uncharacterized protein n=1 Tax=Endocarpon pusillum TaxID=364733 RepID=A0A8H7AL84_9EURO|nr:hypothetical protein GJ744_008412 [Endocarpon pusillum]
MARNRSTAAWLRQWTEPERHPQNQSNLLSLPVEVRLIIWQYLRLKRKHYYGPCLMWAYKMELDDEAQNINIWKPRIHDFYGLAFACRLTYTEIQEVHNPTTLTTHHYDLNMHLYLLLDAGRPIPIDELELKTEGSGPCALTSMVDVRDVQRQIARTLLELKRQYESVEFKGISWIDLQTSQTGTGAGGTTEIRHFRLRWKVHVGRKRRRARGGPIRRGKKYRAQVWAREVRSLEERLPFAELDKLLNQMEDTPEGGVLTDEYVTV